MRKLISFLSFFVFLSANETQEVAPIKLLDINGSATEEVIHIKPSQPNLRDINKSDLNTTALNEEKDWWDKFLEFLGQSDKIDASSGIDWSILPGPFANPLKGVGFGVAAVGFYEPYDYEKDLQLSTLSLKTYVSSNGSYGLGVENRTYLKNDDLRIFVDAWISHEPRYYWGIGRKLAENNANKSEHKAQVVEVSPKIAYKFLPYTYLIAGWDYKRYANQKLNSTLLSKDELKNKQSSGYVVLLEYDSRDFQPNPYKGLLLSLAFVDYRKVLGSSYDYKNLIFNYRQYQKVGKKNVFAWDLYAQKLFGNVPWYNLAQLGDASRMRGYYQGRFRDRNMISTQIEWRHQFNAYHGMVTFIGAGNISNRVRDIFEDEWFPSYGIGYRFAFKPRVNVRFDFAVGRDGENGFYFNINEAF